MYHEHNRTQPWVTQKKTIPSCPQCTRAAKERLAWWEYTRWYCTKKQEGLWLHGRKPGYTIPQDGRAIYYFWETCHWTFCRQNRCKKIAWQKNVTERLGWAMQQEAKERVLVIIIHPRLKPGENGCPIWDREKQKHGKWKYMAEKDKLISIAILSYLKSSPDCPLAQSATTRGRHNKCLELAVHSCCKRYTSRLDKSYLSSQL